MSAQTHERASEQVSGAAQPRPNPRPWHQRGWWVALLVTALVSAAAVTVLVMMLAPPLSSALAAETADGQRSFAIENNSAGGEEAALDLGSVGTVTPKASWSVQPAGAGLLLRSPDRVLAVKMTPENEGAELSGVALVEVLSNGMKLRHTTENNVFVGELATPEGVIYIEARLAAHAGSEHALIDYRPALSSLIESVRAP